MKQKKEKKDTIKVLKYFKVAKFEIILMIFFELFCCGIGIVNPIINANLLTSLTEFNIQSALFFALLFVLLAILNSVFTTLTNIIYLKGIKKKVFISLRKDMIKTIFGMKTANFDEHTSGEFSERLRSDPENVSSILTVVQYSIFNMIADFIVLVYVFLINYIIGIVYVIGILAVFLYEKYAWKTNKKIAQISKKLNDKNSTLLNETMRGIRDIKILNIMNPIYKLVSRSLDDSTDNDIKRESHVQIIWETVKVIQAITTFVIIIAGIILVDKKLLSVTNLLIIYMYRTNIFDLILCYTSIKDYSVNYKVASSRIFELMDPKKFPKETFGKEIIKNAKGKIECRNLSFAYSKKKILNNVNFILEPNDTVGIVGASGSGKTTLLNLINKSYDVKDNQIFIDNIDINKLSKDSIKDNISMISQNPYLFNLTIRENLELMNENVTEKEIIHACKIAQIHDFIMSLPDKYDSLLGEGGTNLSGGQKQRLAIARALIKKSKIILLDEATSALDNVTQQELQKSINNITDDYTMIIVAHRLSTIKDCNKIFVMDNGNIVGVGTHKELLKNNEIYKKLYLEETK